MITPSSSSAGNSQLEELIYYHLEYFAFEDAILLAELYHQQVKTDDSLYLLAQCLLKSGQLEAVFKLLNLDGLKTPQLRYLSQEAEAALRMDEEPCLHLAFEDSSVKPFAHALLARIFLESGRTAEAMAENCRAVERNKLSWSTLKMHCDLGSAAEVETLCSKLIRQANKARDAHKKESTSSCSAQKQIVFPFKSPEKRTPIMRDSKDFIAEKISCLGPKKPRTAAHFKSLAGKRTSDFLRRRVEGGVEIRRSSRLLQDSENLVSVGGDVRRTTRVRVSSSNVGSNRVLPEKLRSINRLSEAEMNRLVRGDSPSPQSSPLMLHKILDTPDTIPDSPPKIKLAQGAKTGHDLQNPLYPLGSHDQNSLHNERSGVSALSSPPASSVSSCASSQVHARHPSVSGLSDVSRRVQSVSHLLSDCTLWTPLFVDIAESVAHLGRVQSLLSRCSPAKALKYFDELPEHCSITPLGREILARIFFERLEYSKTREILERLHQEYPHRLSGMEVLSTALWHEQDSRRLSMLAAELTENARNAAETWCAAGNCFSVQKQHETAIECFERAITLKPRFAYAYTLLGHELLDTDRLDKAASSFRRALCLCPTDYRAWFGLGLLHFKREQLTWARFYLNRAVSINSCNSVLLCQLSVVEQALHNNHSAMELLNRALKIAPNNAACRFYRARLLYEMHSYEECRTALNDLKLFAHDEAQVFFLLGRVYKKLNNTHLALLNFSWAAEMDPRGEQNQTTRSECAYDDDPGTPGGQ